MATLLLEQPIISDRFINVIITLFVLSIISERLANFIKLNFPEQSKWWNTLLGVNFFHIKTKTNNYNNEKLREKRVLFLALISGFIVALAVKANIIEILQSTGDNSFGWKDKSFWDYNFYDKLKILSGCLLSAFFISMGSKFWHDMLDMLFYAKNLKQRLAEPEIYNSTTIAQLDNIVLSAEDVLITNTINKLKDKLVKEEGVTSVGIAYIRDNVVQKRIMRIGISDKKIEDTLIKKYKEELNAKDARGNEIAIAYKFELTGKAVTNLCIARGSSTGSLACAVKSKNNSKQYALTCYHVVKRETDQWLCFNYNSQISIQQGNKDIGNVVVGFRADNLDICLIELNANAECFSPFGYREVSEADENKTEVYFKGCSTKEGSGIIVHNTAVHTVQINYNDGSTFEFTDVILISATADENRSAISKPGDSGSLIVDRYGNALGIIVGADDKYTYAMKLSNIMNNLQLTL